jgi:hypothetical protein
MAVKKGGYSTYTIFVPGNMVLPAPQAVTIRWFLIFIFYLFTVFSYTHLLFQYTWAYLPKYW